MMCKCVFWVVLFAIIINGASSCEQQIIKGNLVVKKVLVDTSKVEVSSVVSGVSSRPKFTITFSEEMLVTKENLESITLQKQDGAETVPLNYIMSTDKKNVIASLRPTSANLQKGVVYKLFVHRQIKSITTDTMQTNAEVSLNIDTRSDLANMLVNYKGTDVVSVKDTFTVIVANSEDISKIPLSLSVSNGARLSDGNVPLTLTNGVITKEFDFSGGMRLFRVTSEDMATVKTYIVQVSKFTLTSKEITSFKFAYSNNKDVITEDAVGQIDKDTIKVVIKKQPNVADYSLLLLPAIEHTGGSILPSAMSRNYANPVEYVVTARDGSTKKYTVIVYIEVNITFVTNEQVTIQPIKGLLGDFLVKPADPVVSGKFFVGWFIDNNTYQTEFHFNDPVSKSYTLYAKWVTVTYQLNGGLASDGALYITPTVTTSSTGVKTVNKPSDPKRTASTFEGWYIDQNLTQPYLFTEPLTQSIIIYAKWGL